MVTIAGPSDSNQHTLSNVQVSDAGGDYFCEVTVTPDFLDVTHGSVSANSTPGSVVVNSKSTGNDKILTLMDFYHMICSQFPTL